MIKILKSNVKPSLAALIFATKVESVGEFKAEYKRAEKLLRESRSRPKHVSEIGQEGGNGDGVHREAVEALAPRHSPSSDRQRGNGGAVKYDKRWVSTGNINKHPNERHHMQSATSRAGQPNQEATTAVVTYHHTSTSDRSEDSAEHCFLPVTVPSVDMLCVRDVGRLFFKKSSGRHQRKSMQVSLPQHGLFRMRQK
uniref:Uncharacterized protein n=1 Tax=Glossina palpalis gambiensis TaxID=67801 RepID=A0A1B0AL74_9MUSC